ncbi:type IV pilus modification protein PilV [Arenicella sp.]|nr:type IV pilus modification protein PilV [Arenicella sp.]
MKHTHKRAYANRQSGLSLVEILVTVVILAGGSLGIAAMQITSLNYAAGSYGRTQAVALAQDMANRLLANRAYALDIDADGDIGPGIDNYEIADFVDSFATGNDCVANTCTPAELADYDRNRWLQDVARALPSGEGRILVINDINLNGIEEVRFEIGLQWRQVANSTVQDSADDDEIKSFTFRVML